MHWLTVTLGTVAIFFHLVGYIAARRQVAALKEIQRDLTMLYYKTIDATSGRQILGDHEISEWGWDLCGMYARNIATILLLAAAALHFFL